MTFSNAVFLQAFPVLLDGLWVTVLVVATSLAFGTLLGVVACIGQLLQRGVATWLSRTYVGLFRGLPETVLIFWIYFCVPFVFDVRLSAFMSGAIALSLVSGAYLGEIFRAGIAAVPKGQFEAARAVGFTLPVLAAEIVAPQAFRIMLPALLGFVTILIKNSGITSAIGVAEVFYKGQVIAGDNFKHFEVFTAVGILYFCLIFPISLASRLLEARLAAAHR